MYLAGEFISSTPSLARCWTLQRRAKSSGNFAIFRRDLPRLVLVEQLCCRIVGPVHPQRNCLKRWINLIRYFRTNARAMWSSSHPLHGKASVVEGQGMKRTARIALATALLIGSGATLAMAQPLWNPNYNSYAWPTYGPLYNLAPHYFPGSYPGAPAYRYWDTCCYWGGRWGYWRYWGWR